MKNLFLVAILLTSSLASAGEAILSEKIVSVPVTINDNLVKWSKADYAMPVVKVLVPGIADVTFLNHRNTREGAPCLAAYGAESPADVIRNSPGTENIAFKITLTKVTRIDATNVCHVVMREDIIGQIRGHEFLHSREVDVGTRHADDCR